MSPKAKNIISTVAAALLGLAFAGSGITKVIGVEMQVQNFHNWGFPDWTRYPVGLAEVIMGVGLILPKTRRLTSLLVYGWAVGAVLTHVQAGEFDKILAPLPFVLLNTVIAYMEHAKQKDLHLSVANAR